MRKIRLPALLLAAVAANFITTAGAQLYSDFSADTDDDTPANIYFGAAKDADGDYIHGATVVLSSDMMDFVAVTDHRGRFRLRLPVELAPADIEVRCSHNAYRGSKVFRRLPRDRALSPVEISCRLR